MNNAVFEKNMENEKKQSEIKLVTTAARKELFDVRTKLSYSKQFFR